VGEPSLSQIFAAEPPEADQKLGNGRIGGHTCSRKGIATVLAPVYDVAPMAQPNFSTTDTVGPIQDPDARRVCSLATIDTARQKVFTLRQLRDGLDISIQDLEAQRRKDKIINTALVVARFTKATCDAFISMAGALGKAVLPKPAGEQVERFAAGYAAATPLVDAAATSAAGGNADWVKAGATSVKEGVSLVTHNKGIEIVTKSTVVKVEIIKGAMNHDKEGIIKSAVDYTYDLNTTVAEMAGEKGEAGAALAKVAKSAFEYNEQIGKAFDQLIDDDLESQERIHALKSNLVHQAKLLSKKIDEMEQFITSCDYQLNPPESLVCS